MTGDEASALYYWFRSGRIRAELITEEDGEPGVRIWALPEDGTEVRAANFWNTPRTGNRAIVDQRDAKARSER
jgi:hypothetical protein